MKKWDFNKIKLSAKKYKTKEEWRQGKNTSYYTAADRGLLNNKIIVGHFLEPKRWTLKKIVDDAKKYKFKKNWYETPKSSYDAARSRGLLKNKEVIGHFNKTIYPSKWTLKKIIAAAKKFSTKKEWLDAEKTKVCFSYRAAKERKLLFDKRVIGHFKNMDPAKKWTYLNIINTARKCKTLKEWREKYPYAYHRASKTRVLNKVSGHLKRIGHKYLRCIYTIEVRGKKIIYIGLSFNLTKRLAEHLNSKRFKDIKKIYGKNCLIVNQVTKYLPVNKAAKKEDILISKYKKKGFKVLNKKSGGDLGSIASKWTKEKVIQSAKKFKTQKEWRAKVPSAYAIAKRKGYLKSAQKFLYVQKEKIRY